MLPTKFLFIWQSDFRDEDFQKSTNQKQELLVAPYLLLDWDEMSILYRRPPIDASYQVSVHLAKPVSEEKIFQKSSNQKQELSMAAIFVNGQGRNEQSQQRTFHRCFPTKFRFIWPNGFREESNFFNSFLFFTDFLRSATAMFDGSRGHHSWSERELYMYCSFIVWQQHCSLQYLKN